MLLLDIWTPLLSHIKAAGTMETNILVGQAFDHNVDSLPDDLTDIR